MLNADRGRDKTWRTPRNATLGTGAIVVFYAAGSIFITLASGDNSIAPVPADCPSGWRSKP